MWHMTFYIMAVEIKWEGTSRSSQPDREEGLLWALHCGTRGRAGCLRLVECVSVCRGHGLLQQLGPCPFLHQILVVLQLFTQRNKYNTFTYTRVLNNLSFMTYPEGILPNISPLFGMFFICYSDISELSSTDLTSPVRTESLSLLKKQIRDNLNQGITSQSPWSVNPSFSFSIASPSSSEKTGSPSCCFLECTRYERK